VSSAFCLAEPERARRYDLLVKATTAPEPPLLSDSALQLLVGLASVPRTIADLPGQLRPQLDRLIAAGLVDSDGRLAPTAADLVAVMRDPDIWLRIEAVAGPRLGVWTAWLSDQRAVIATQPGPADDYSLLTAMPGWVPVAAFGWLGIGPRDPLGGRAVLPMAVLLRWLDEPDTPLPGGDPVLTEIWVQPGQLWAIDVEPDGGRVLVLDAVEAGLWLVTAEDAEQDTDEAVLTPLPPHTLWRLLLTFIARANATTRASKAAGPGKVPADVGPAAVLPAVPAANGRRNDGLL
jgi:hypothetical protein